MGELSGLDGTNIGKLQWRHNDIIESLALYYL